MSCQFQLIDTDDGGRQCAAAGARTHTAAEADDFGPMPTAFLAATRKVYCRPLVRPVMTALVFLE